MTDESRPPDEGADGRSAFTQEQDAALKKLAAGEGNPLELAKVLRQLPELLDLYPQLPNTYHVHTVRGLAQLSSADAFALVESGRVPINQAALAGDYARSVFAHHHPPQVCEDFQVRAMSRLTESQPASVEYAFELVEKVGNDVLNEQKAEQRRLDCERVWNEPFWSVWHVLSWIAFRDAVRLCEIKDENSLKGVKFYGPKRYGSPLKEAKPEYFLLVAPKKDHLKAVRKGAELPDIYWADKHRVDRDVQFRQADVRRCWPGSGKAWQLENASYAQAKHAHERRKYLEQYKDQLEQGVEIRAELERACSAQGMEAQATPSPETPGPIAAALDLWRDWNATDLADLSEAAAVRHAELKSALTPDRETALRELETGKSSPPATARIVRSAPQLLDVLPDAPLVQKVRELAQMLNAAQEWDGFLEDKFWTLGQTILWLLMRDPWVVDQASNDTGGEGESFGEIKAAILMDLLNLNREDIQDAAKKLRRRCLNGLPAIDEQGSPIPEIEWRHLKIALHSDNTPYIVRREQSSFIPAYPNVVFLRDDVLREFPPERRSEGQGVTTPPAGAQANPTRRDVPSLDGVWQVSLDAGDAPLFEAVHWIATKGGSIGFHPEQWDSAWSEIAVAWTKNELKVLGRPVGRLSEDNFPQAIPGEKIAGAHSIPPFPWRAHEFGDPISGTGPYVEFWGRTDRTSWETKGFNDKLYVPGKGGWTHLTVQRADVEYLWPFGSAALPEAIRPRTDPPAPSKESKPVPVEEKHANVLKIARTFVANGVAPNLKAHTTLVMRELTGGSAKYRMRRGDVEALLKDAFAAQRRKQGNPNSKRS